MASAEIADQFSKHGKKVILLDAAVLLTAGWHKTLCNEVWSCIVSPKEAEARIVERDGKTPEEARARLRSQPPNEDVVAQSNVVFSTEWAEEFSQMQAEKAWEMLTEERLNADAVEEAAEGAGTSPKKKKAKKSILDRFVCWKPQQRNQ